MPLYEYECFVCHKRFERIRRVADASRVDCPACGGKVRRLLGVPALQFKGSGWYVTDYGKGNGNRSTALAKKEDAPPSPPEKTEAPGATATKKATEGN
ncbi:MAG: zinc ribbon domain-containing protein [Holophagae bacterium]|jgi:putative FmdB family regulatory protein